MTLRRGALQRRSIEQRCLVIPSVGEEPYCKARAMNCRELLGKVMAKQSVAMQGRSIAEICLAGAERSLALRGQRDATPCRALALSCQELLWRSKAKRRCAEEKPSEAKMRMAMRCAAEEVIGVEMRKKGKVWRRVAAEK